MVWLRKPRLKSAVAKVATETDFRISIDAFFTSGDISQISFQTGIVFVLAYCLLPPSSSQFVTVYDIKLSSIFKYAEFAIYRRIIYNRKYRKFCRYI